jgi:hypothetical protein
MAKDELHKKGEPQGKRNPTQGYENPFFRDYEKRFVGGEMTITSPVNSVFDERRTRKDGSNTMEDVLHEQAPAHAKKVVSKGAK